ncbi:MAG: hypothetical protein AAFW81_05665 [Pseudomonadota bacterium]
MAGVDLVLLGLGVWFGVGALVAILFVAFGVGRVDAAAKGASWLFRPTIFLGCAILWPFILVRWASGKRINEPHEEGS